MQTYVSLCVQEHNKQGASTVETYFPFAPALLRGVVGCRFQLKSPGGTSGDDDASTTCSLPGAAPITDKNGGQQATMHRAQNAHRRTAADSRGAQQGAGTKKCRHDRGR